MGAIAGVVAGIIFAVFEMLAAAAQGMPAVMPLRMIAAIGLGGGSLQAGAASAGDLLVAALIHMALSAVYGVVFAAVVGFVALLRGSRWAVVAAGTVFGFLLWIVNFYVISPLVFPWFGMANPVVQFLAHTFFFGTALGLITAAELLRLRGSEGSTRVALR
jgi:hypothetical protein